jgi:hypothetical protein
LSLSIDQSDSMVKTTDQDKQDAISQNCDEQLSSTMSNKEEQSWKPLVLMGIATAVGSLLLFSLIYTRR